jgi:hypothetical protein
MHWAGSDGDWLEPGAEQLVVDRETEKSGSPAVCTGGENLFQSTRTSGCRLERENSDSERCCTGEDVHRGMDGSEWSGRIQLGNCSSAAGDSVITGESCYHAGWLGFQLLEHVFQNPMPCTHLLACCPVQKRKKACCTDWTSGLLLSIGCTAYYTIYFFSKADPHTATPWWTLGVFKSLSRRMNERVTLYSSLWANLFSWNIRTYTLK